MTTGYARLVRVAPDGDVGPEALKATQLEDRGELDVPGSRLRVFVIVQTIAEPAAP